MNSPGLLQFSAVKQQIDGRKLLDIDELTLHQGKCILLCGDNGTGKTTLVKILAGLAVADAIHIRCRGKPSPPTAHRALLRKMCVYLHQQPYMFDCDVFHNIAYGLRRRGLARPEIKRRVQAGLDWGKLTHLAARNGRKLSGGERQRVALVRARVLQAPVLLLDEPTAGMDGEAHAQALQLIRCLCDEGSSIIVISHENIPETVFDRRLRLQGGHLHACGEGHGQSGAQS